MYPDHKVFHLEIVSVEAEVFSGYCHKVFVNGMCGSLEVLVNHTAMLTALSPGPVWLERQNGEEEAFVVCGGVLEVKNNVVIILADTALQATDISESAAVEAKLRAQQHFSVKKEFDYSLAKAEINTALSQLRILRNLKVK